MKKILLIMGVIILGTIGFADAKTDYTNAENLAKNNKIAESVKLLESVSNSGDKTYAIKANFQLGAYYLQNKNLVNAKKYLGLVWNDTNDNAPEKDEAARLLYTIALSEKKVTEAQKYIEWADKKSGADDVDTTSGLIIFYFENSMQAKGDTRYNTAMKSPNIEYKSEINYNIGQYYLSKKNTVQAKKYLQTSYDLSPVAIIPAGYLLYQIELNTNNPAGAEKILLDMNTKTGNKDIEALMMLGSYYLQNNNTAKAEEYLKKASSIDTKDVDTRVLLLGLYEVQNNTAKINAIYNELKAIVPAKELNKNLGVAFANLGNGNLAEKYLKKAINEDKDNQAKLPLGQVYALVGKKNEAITILKEAVNNKVQGASELLKQVEAMN